MLTITAHTRVMPALMEVVADPYSTGPIETAWYEWENDAASFGRIIFFLIGRKIFFCDCGEIVFRNDTRTVSGGDRFCTGCIEADYTPCHRCDTLVPDDETVSAGGYEHCDDCIASHFTRCYDCEEYERDRDVTYVAGGESVCESCRDNSYYYCEDCEDYYPDSHDHGCSCEAPLTRFVFPANGAGTVANNERLRVELPKGTIDDVGMGAIASLLYHRASIYLTDAEKLVNEVGPMWQAKRGNFTRRLSSAYYKAHAQKLSAEVISEVGNLARAHSSEGASWLVEFTRDLNGSASEFGHGASCWWQSYYNNRCALKNWGGIGLRSYGSLDDHSSYPSGRSWIQPLDEDLEPTHDALGAHAYVVYNGYGEMEGYTATRIVAHLTGRTYKKIAFELHGEGMYVNGDSGFLVADEATLAETTRIEFEHEVHDQMDAHRSHTFASPAGEAA